MNDPFFVFHILLSPNDLIFLEIFIVENGHMLSLNDAHFHQ